MIMFLLRIKSIRYYIWGCNILDTVCWLRRLTLVLHRLGFVGKCTKCKKAIGFLRIIHWSYVCVSLLTVRWVFSLKASHTSWYHLFRTLNATTKLNNGTSVSWWRLQEKVEGKLQKVHPCKPKLYVFVS